MPAHYFTRYLNQRRSSRLDALPRDAMSTDLPQTLLDFIRVTVPAYHAAELLVFLATHRDRDFTAEEVVIGMRPLVITVPAVREHVAHFTAARLVVEAGGRFRCAPASAELERRVGELVDAYNERPVTLIQTFGRIGA